MFAITVREIDQTNNSNRGYFQQTPFWCSFKEKHGWNYQKFEVEYSLEDHNLQKKEEIGVLTRSFAKGTFTLAYIPLFPELPFKGVLAKDQGIEFCHLLNDLALSLKPYLPKNTICVRFDPAVDFSSPEERDEFVYGTQLISFADRLKVRKTKVDIQPPDSTQIDLTPSEEEILNNMKTKWRYNVNLSSRKGVLIEKINGNSEDLDQKLDIFYDLYKITAERDGIGIHPKSYYKDLLTSSSSMIAEGKDVPEVNLYIAKHEEDYLGAIITLFSKDESIYLYGCSSNVKRNLMPNFLLQWTAMKDAKQYGSKYYDMYGMPPTDDPNHPMHGLYLFKTGFGGNNIHRIGSYDVSLKFIYRYYVKAENFRAFWHKKVLKKIRGR